MTIRVRYESDAYDTQPITSAHDGEWFDLRSAEDIHMIKGDFRMISLGVSMELPEGYEAHVLPRSSTFKHYGILLVNGMGIIDHKYCGDADIWHFPALATRECHISKGDRICQFRIVKQQKPCDIKVVSSLGNESRGGFGSTGIR